MKTIYLMRHGETLFNTMDVNQGQCDSPLTENGICQAQKAKAWFDEFSLMRYIVPRRSVPAIQQKLFRVEGHIPVAKD